MSLTGKEKTKWARLKKEIIKRPFLAYKIGLTSEEVETLCSRNYPPKERIYEIDKLLLKERQKNVERLRSTLTKVVGYRGSVQFAERIDSDAMTVKYIIDNKLAKAPSHDLISRIENHLAYITDFEVSIENKIDEPQFVPNKIDDLRLDTLNVANDLHAIISCFHDLKLADKKRKKAFAGETPRKFKIADLQRKLDAAITELQKIRSQVEVVISDYVG